MSKEKLPTTEPNESELLDIKQSASLLNVSEASLRRWTDSGTLPCYRVGAQRARRFRREDLVAFISLPREGASSPSGMERPESVENATKTEVAGMDTASPPPGLDRPDSVKNATKTQVSGMDLAYHDHICAIYGRSAGRLKLSVPLFREGLMAGDICFLNATQRSKVHILKVLREVYPGVGEAIKEGQLVFPELKRNKAEMLDQLEDMFLKSTYSGKNKLRLVGDMEWALSVDWSEQQIYEFELEYNNTLGHRFPIMSLCQYDVRVFSSKGILDALKSHEDTYKYQLRDCCF